jgi:hypothetical protein
MVEEGPAIEQAWRLPREKLQRRKKDDETKDIGDFANVHSDGYELRAACASGYRRGSPGWHQQVAGQRKAAPA